MRHDSFPGPKAFARWALQGNRLTLRPMVDQVMAWHGGAMESILFREGPWQVELIVGWPNSKTAMHRHLRCASADLPLNGWASGSAGGRPFAKPRSDVLVQQIRTVGRNEWHGGTAGDKGFVYLSFQQWFDGEPTFISQDWEAWTEQS